MLFRMILLYLPHLAIYWYGGFVVNIGHGFTQIIFFFYFKNL
jgi:hypothetical protein